MFDNLCDENREKWKIQWLTPYKDLSGKEKEADRIWARKVFKIFNKEHQKEIKELQNILKDTAPLKDYKFIQQELKQKEKQFEKMIDEVEKEYIKKSLKSSPNMKIYYSHKIDALVELKCFIKDKQI